MAMFAAAFVLRVVGTLRLFLVAQQVSAGTLPEVEVARLGVGQGPHVFRSPDEVQAGRT